MTTRIILSKFLVEDLYDSEIAVLDENIDEYIRDRFPRSRPDFQISRDEFLDAFECIIDTNEIDDIDIEVGVCLITDAYNNSQNIRRFNRPFTTLLL